MAFLQFADATLLSKFISLSQFESMPGKIAIRLAKNLEVDLAIELFGKLTKRSIQHSVLRILIPKITDSAMANLLVQTCERIGFDDTLLQIEMTSLLPENLLHHLENDR